MPRRLWRLSGKAEMDQTGKASQGAAAGCLPVGEVLRLDRTPQLFILAYDAPLDKWFPQNYSFDLSCCTYLPKKPRTWTAASEAASGLYSRWWPWLVIGGMSASNL